MKFQGIFTPTITPLDENEHVDEASFITHLNRLIDFGIHGLFLLGSSGESVALTADQRRKAMEIAVDAVDGRIPIICGVMGASTKQVIENIYTAQKFNISAVAATPPYYYPSTSADDIKTFYGTVAQNSDLPVCIYNIPVLVKTSIQPETVRDLADEYENIVAIKDSTGDWTTFMKLHAYLGHHQNFSILLGSYTMAGAAITFGADGAIISISNVDPKRAVDLYHAAQNHQIAEVDRINKELLDLGKLYSYGAQISCLKACMELIGICSDKTTSPLLPLQTSHKLELKELLSKNKLL